jgi:hypothetical protein
MLSRLTKKNNFQLTNSGLEDWFYKALTEKFNYFNRGWGGYYGTYYEFGVGFGDSLTMFIKAMNRFCNNNNILSEKFNIFLFDSFEGLPDSELKEDTHKEWSKGQYAKSIEEIQSIVDGLNIGKSNIEYVKGYYNDTLNPKLYSKLKLTPPSIVNIDVDYYSSTKIILEFLDKFIPSGTLFYFDDVWAFSGNPNYGELKAINEFNKNELSGYFTSYPILGMNTKAYIYSRKEFEFV